MSPLRTPGAYRLLLLGLGAALLVSCIAALGFGPAAVPQAHVWGILAERLGLGGVGEWSRGQEHIVWLIRAPRVLLGALVGAGLALGGALQAATRNPLADPHLLGVSSGAALGAVLVLLYLGEFIGVLSLPLAAFVGALGSMLLVLAIASRHGRLESDRLLLAGSPCPSCMALVNLLLFLGDHHAASSVVFWMLGGLGAARWELLWPPALCLVLGLVALLAQARG